MSKREKTIYQQYRDLNNSGWQIPNTQEILCRANGGSESLKHRVAKTVAASVLVDAGYRTHSEVETDAGDEADVLGYGLADRKPVVIELENSLTQEVKSKKLSQYLRGGVSEVWVIDLDNAPKDPSELYTHIQEVTGL